MATKNKTKKEAPKTNVSEEKKAVEKIDEQKATSLAKDLKKEEIKEIVEETVEEVLKKESDKKNDNSSGEAAVVSDSPSSSEEKEDSQVSSEVPVVASESTQTQEPTELTSPQATVSPVQQEVSVPTPTSTDAPIFSHPLGAAIEPAAPTKGKSSSLKIFLIFLFLGIIVGVVFLWFATTHGMLSLTKMSLPTFVKPTVTPTMPPTPTVAEKQVDLSKYTIKVLNGSGIAGAAAKAKDALSTAGYNVQGTGNADTSDFTQTVVEAKSSVDKTYLTELMKSLGATYDVSQSTSTLNDSASTDVVVTIGSSTK